MSATTDEVSPSSEQRLNSPHRQAHCIASIFSGMAAFAGILFFALVTLAHADDQKLSAVRVGYQKYGTLNVLKAEGSFEKSLASRGVSVTWILFPTGPQLLEALNAGSIDFGATGEAPPVFAQAAGVNLVYFGNQPPFPKGEGVLVKKDSPIQNVQRSGSFRSTEHRGHFLRLKTDPENDSGSRRRCADSGLARKNQTLDEKKRIMRARWPSNRRERLF